MNTSGRPYSVFVDASLLASGSLATVLSAAKSWLDRNGDGTLLIFDDRLGRQVDFDFRGTLEDVLARALTPASPSRGRPRLGVQSREISLLPRHWEWLQTQPKGASATLRLLVEEKMADQFSPLESAELARDAANRFMTTMAGNRPGFEEACRALYRRERRRFYAQTATWPAAVKSHARKLAAPWFEMAPPSD